jgi:hypothetical protein
MLGRSGSVRRRIAAAAASAVRARSQSRQPNRATSHAATASPAAAASTLRTRSGTAETETAEEADEVGERMVLDQTDTDASETVDVPPGGQEGGEEDTERDRFMTADAAVEYGLVDRVVANRDQSKGD